MDIIEDDVPGVNNLHLRNMMSQGWKGEPRVPQSVLSAASEGTAVVVIVVIIVIVVVIIVIVVFQVVYIIIPIFI